MFDKAAVFTDLHLGLKSNSRIHNQDCEDFVDWYIDQAKQNGCETGIFCGDLHHNRNTLNVTTMQHSLRILEKLGESFDQFFYFPGNHDLYYKDKRDVHSVEYAKHIPGITVINELYERDDVAMVPWLVEDEWKRAAKMKSRYMFGHFELPHFYMNAMVQMPDTGELKAEHFANQEYVFTGHFHKRQQRGKVHYIGNAFPHNFADAWDDARGMMILDKKNNQEPFYIDWPDAPKYRTAKLSELLEPGNNIAVPKSYIRVTLDLPISFEEASFIKETYIEQHGCREITLIPQKQIDEISTEVDISAFESIDEIVSKEITSIESESFDSSTLLSIYNEL